MHRKPQKNPLSIRTGNLVTEIAAIRDACQQTMKMLSSTKAMTRAKLAECARLGDSLEATNRFLKSAVAHEAFARRRNRGEQPI
jgi:hypothetical protein